MIEEEICGLLQAATPVTDLIGTRLYPCGAPRGAALPRVRYTMIGNMPVNALTATRTKLRSPHMQIDCEAADYTSARSLASKVKAALTDATTSNLKAALLIDEHVIDEPPIDADDRHIFRFILDYHFWLTEQIT